MFQTKLQTQGLRTPGLDSRAQNLAGFSPLVSSYKNNPELQTTMSSILAASTDVAHQAISNPSAANADRTIASVQSLLGRYQGIVTGFLNSSGGGPRSEKGAAAGATVGSGIAQRTGMSPELGAMVGAIFGGSLGGGSLGSILSLATQLISTEVPTDAQFVDRRDT